MKMHAEYWVIMFVLAMLALTTWVVAPGADKVKTRIVDDRTTLIEALGGKLTNGKTQEKNSD